MTLSTAVPKSMVRGAFIVLEGCDRSGKSTQALKLVNHLTNVCGLPAKLVRFPDRSTPTGKLIDAYLKQSCEMDNHCIHLLFSANRWELMKSIKEDLLSGITVVADRYAYSGVAFSAAKVVLHLPYPPTPSLLMFQGLDISWCKSCDSGLITPDVVFFLNAPLDAIQSRSDFGNERYETASFQQVVYQIFHDWSLSDIRWQSVNASKSIDEVFADLKELALKTILKKDLCELQENLFIN